jgi:hypothetical protein
MSSAPASPRRATPTAHGRAGCRRRSGRRCEPPDCTRGPPAAPVRRSAGGSSPPGPAARPRSACEWSADTRMDSSTRRNVAASRPPTAGSDGPARPALRSLLLGTPGRPGYLLSRGASGPVRTPGAPAGTAGTLLLSLRGGETCFCLLSGALQLGPALSCATAIARGPRLSGLAPANAHPGQHQQRHDDDDGDDDRPHPVSLDHRSAPKGAWAGGSAERARSRGGTVALDLGGAVKAAVCRPHPSRSEATCTAPRVRCSSRPTPLTVEPHRSIRMSRPRSRPAAAKRSAAPTPRAA